MPIEWGVFVPELLVGALTTLGFGFILWQVQRRTDARQFARELSFTWAGVRARTVRIVNGASFAFRGNSASEFGSLPRELVALCDDKPLEAWYRELRDPDILVLNTAFEAVETARILGETLDQSLNSGVVRLRPATESPDKVMGIVRSFAYGSTRTIRLAVYQAEEPEMRDLERAALRLARQPGVLDNVMQYREGHRHMLEQIKILERTFPKDGKVRIPSNGRPLAERG